MDPDLQCTDLKSETACLHLQVTDWNPKTAAAAVQPVAFDQQWQQGCCAAVAAAIPRGAVVDKPHQEADVEHCDPAAAAAAAGDTCVVAAVGHSRAGD